MNRFKRALRLSLLAGMLSVFGFWLWPGASQAATEARKRPAVPPAGNGGFVCGTYQERMQDEMLASKIHQARLAGKNFIAAPARTYAAGNFAVIEDNGTMIIEPFINVFDLDTRRLHFAPNGSGSYDITSLPFAFDTNFGTNLNAGDDTNHRITFAAGFSFPFFGTTWDHVWIRSNANVTFGGIGNPDFFDPGDFFLELPIIAALFADLNPAASGRVLYRQAADRFIITWDRIPEFGTNNSNTVQLTLFPDGSFDMAYNGVAIRRPINDLPMAVGFNSGKPNTDFVEVDLSNLPITGSNAGALFEAFQEVLYRQVNIVPLVRRFYATQPDSFDQVVLITNFNLLGAPFAAFYYFVRNDVSGIGLNLFDLSGQLGSAGRLQGFLHMNHVNFWPALAANDIYLDVLGQEAEHEWGAFVDFNRDGQPSDLLLGRELGHWNFFLDTDGSVMEGNGWRDNGNGTFTSVRSFDNYSHMDHYLIGLRAPEEVAPFFLIEVPGATLAQRSANPQLGVIATGPKELRKNNLEFCATIF